MRTLLIIGQNFLKSPGCSKLLFQKSDDLYIVNENKYLYKKSNYSKRIRQDISNHNIDSIVFAGDNENSCKITSLFRGINTPSYYIPAYRYSDIKTLDDVQDIGVKIDLEKPRLDQVEYHISDHCNLNCKGCNHFCNLETLPKFANFDSYLGDMRQLKKLFWGVGTVLLVGGEPLLNPDLPKYIVAARDIFPDSNLIVVTNGLLLPKISNELVSAMVENNAIFNITNYPPTNKLKYKIIQKLGQTGIPYIYDDTPLSSFSRQLTREPINDMATSYSFCPTKGCHFLNDGVIYTCTLLGRIHKYNEVYGTHYPEKQGYDIYNCSNGWELYELLHKPIAACRFCSPYAESFPWKPAYGQAASADDWIVDSNDISRLKLRWYLLSPSAVVSHYTEKYPRIRNFLKRYYGIFNHRNK